MPQIHNFIILQVGLAELGQYCRIWQPSCVFAKHLVLEHKGRDFRQQFVFAGKAHYHVEAFPLGKACHAASQVGTVLRIQAAKQIVKVNPLRIFHPHAGQQHAT